jgi:hypothetical protein
MQERYLDSAATVERFTATIESTGDPTGSPVSWQLTAESAQPNAGLWVSGTWGSGWVDGKAETVSPLTGAAAGFTLTQESDFEVWVKFAVGLETPIIRRVGLLHVR